MQKGLQWQSLVADQNVGISAHLSENSTDGSYKLLSCNVEVLRTGQARRNNPICWQCFDNTTGNITWHTRYLNYRFTPYRISYLHNKFVAIGCDTLAYNTTLFGCRNHEYWTGCVPVCYSQDSLTNGSCSCMGCCETPFPPGIIYYEVAFDKNFNSSTMSDFSHCTYVVVMETDKFTFGTSYVTGYDFWGTYNGRVPVLMDWFIENVTCEVAMHNQRGSHCRSTVTGCYIRMFYGISRASSHLASLVTLSTRIYLPNGLGYICNCSKGYKCNPYLGNRCQGNLYFFFILLVNS